VAGFIPYAKVVQTIRAGYYVVQYGPLVLLGNDVIIALQLIIKLAGKLESPTPKQIASTSFFAGLYYMMGETAGLRGRNPELEPAVHKDAAGLVQSPSPEIMPILRQTAFLARLTYQPTPTDVQRILQHGLPGSILIQAELFESSESPSYILVCKPGSDSGVKEAFLVIRGTSNPADVLIDINAEGVEVSLPGGAGGMAHKGMLTAAQWLEQEMGPALVQLYTKGYKVNIIGHSLGGGIAVLLTALMRPKISTVKCYGFGTPACVDENLMLSLIDCVYSVVNRDS